jgi:hypothetical protein
MNFDPKCYDLALYFLPTDASERQIAALAQHIQESVEDWISFELERLSELATPVRKNEDDG